MAKILESELLKDTVPFKVANVYLYDTKSKIEYGMATLKTSELDAKADQIEVMGGQDSDIIYVLDKPKKIVFNLEDVVENQNITALKMGDGAIRNANSTVTGFHMPKKYTIEKSGTDFYIIVDYIPKDGEELTFKDCSDLTQIDNAKVTQDATNKRKFIIALPTLVEGNEIEVGGYKFQGKGTDMYYNLVSSSSVPELFAVIEEPLVNTEMEHICTKQYILPRTKLDASVTNSADTDPKEVSRKHTLTVLKPKGASYLGTVYFKFPVDDILLDDLTATSSTAKEASLTFTAPVGATSAKVQYKLSTDTTYSDVATSGTSGVYVTGGISAISTSATVKGLTSGSSYDFRIVVVGGDYEGTSNEVTVTIA